jgi:hypothetical protein
MYLETCTKLVKNNVPFTVHYPSDNSCVFTITEHLNNAQLKVVTDLGAIWTLNSLMILINDLGE